MNISFRLKTVIGIALIETIALVVLIWSSVNYLSDSNAQALAKRAEATIQLFAAMTQEAVIATDIAKLETFVSEILNLREIKYVRIYGENQVFAEGGEKRYLNQTFVRDISLDADDDGVFDVAANIEIYGQRFGRVELGLSIQELNYLVDDARNTLGFIAILEILAVAVFSLALGSYLTQSLAQLKDATNKIRLGEFGITVPAKGSDELAAVAFAFNQMSLQMLDNYQKQEQYLSSTQQLSDSLMKSELRMRTVMNTAIDGFVIIDDKGMMVEVNESTETTFGYDRAQMLGQNVSMLMPDEYAQRHDSYLERYLKDGVHHVIGKNRELTGLRSNGEQFPMELTVSEIRQDDEILFVGLVHDLTEIKQAQHELNFMEAIKNGITEASLDALITIDDEGSILDFNGSAEQMYGVSRESVLGKDISEVIIPHQMRDAHRNGMKKYLETGVGPVIGKRIEVTSIRNGGEVFPVELTVTPIKIDEKNFFTAFVRDITEQNQQKDKLKDAIFDAEKANEAKSKFLASMSHEIRTPINAVLGAMNLLEDDEMNSVQKQYIQMAKNSGHSLLSIVNNILDFSKIESGAMEFTENEFSIHQLIDDLMFMFSSTARNKNIEIVSCIDADVPSSIISDKGKLRQVLINLVSNAIKFTRQGGVVVHVEKIFKSDRNWLQFTVVDSGTGIDADAIPQLFKDFSQVENQLSAEHDGSGLGLSICKSLVDIMQGSISVLSETGKGSQFCFNLPLPQDNESISIFDTDKKNIQTVQFQTTNEIQREYFSLQLKQLGLDIKEDSLEQYDLLILDESMIKNVKLSDQFRYRVLLTDDFKKMDKEQSLAFDHVIIKPVMTADLKSLLEAQFRVEQEISNSYKTQEISSIKNQRILVVDDSEANQLIARGMLEKSGYQVEVADNGFSAIESVSNGSYDLVLMDVRMPKMDGLAATRAIRQLATEKSNVPIIALTANAVKEDLEKCIEAGMDAYLTKPVNRNDMLNAISKLVPRDEHIQSKPALELEVNPEELINKQAFLILADDTSPELVSKMVAIFLEESKNRVSNILNSDPQEDISKIGDEAHTLKSTAITFGAPRLHQLSKALEKACRDESVETVMTFIPILEIVASETFSWFDNHFETENNINFQATE